MVLAGAVGLYGAEPGRAECVLKLLSILRELEGSPLIRTELLIETRVLLLTCKTVLAHLHHETGLADFLSIRHALQRYTYGASKPE